MSKIGIAVIGCGDIARARYFPAIAGSPEFELVGVQSRTSSLCEPIVEQYGGRIYPDLDAPAPRFGDRSGRDCDAASEPCRDCDP